MGHSWFYNLAGAAPDSASGCPHSVPVAASLSSNGSCLLWLDLEQVRSLQGSFWRVGSSWYHLRKLSILEPAWLLSHTP